MVCQPASLRPSLLLLQPSHNPLSSRASQPFHSLLAGRLSFIEIHLCMAFASSFSEMAYNSLIHDVAISLRIPWAARIQQTLTELLASLLGETLPFGK